MRRDGLLSEELRLALQWWLSALQLSVAEIHDWVEGCIRPAHLFCDASGSPPHLGAVVFIDGACWWTHTAVPSRWLSFFRRRNDQQIMGLELLAVSLGLSTFEGLLAGRCVVIHCDNSGSEQSMRRGSARSWDHAQLVHDQWFHAARTGMRLFVKRVATDVNIADLPSREVGVVAVRFGHAHLFLSCVA